MKKSVLALLLVLCPIGAMLAQEIRLTADNGVTGQLDTSKWSKQYAEGWCAGMLMAQRLVMQNRDHYRSMLKYPAETLDQSMKRIYAKWPPDPPSGFDASDLVGKAINLEMAGIDLYVILPPLDKMPMQITISVGTFQCPPKGHGK